MEVKFKYLKSHNLNKGLKRGYMKIETIFIRNFRPFGRAGIELSFSNAITTLVGENNIGKSSVLKAIYKSLFLNEPWDSEDLHESDQNNVVEITTVYSLTDLELSDLFKILGITVTVSDFKDAVGNKMTYEFKRTANQNSCVFKLGKYEIANSAGLDSRSVGKGRVEVVSWNYILSSQRGSIKETLERIEKEHKVTIAISFNRSNIINDLLRMINEGILIVEEFRERPDKILYEKLRSSSGRELASVLFNLKNGTRVDRMLFKKIQESFHKIFPSLELEVIRDMVTKEIKILVNKKTIDSTTYFLGAGILESLTLITHLIAAKEKVLFIDHPELHLHPHAQRLLNSLITESPCQSIIVTHSPYFINFSRANIIIRIFQEKENIKTAIFSEIGFTPDELYKVVQFLDINSKEIFFSRKVVLVDGQTELGALPIFASKLGFNFDENGISLISVDGSGNYEIFVKLCKVLEIPVFIIADNDAGMAIKKMKLSYPDLNTFILPGTFENLLSDELKAEAKQNIGDRKPRIGKYVASKMKGIPSDVENIIIAIKRNGINNPKEHMYSSGSK